MLMDKLAAEERPANAASGFGYLLAGAAAVLLGSATLWVRPAPSSVPVFIAAFVVALWCWLGIYTLQPNQAALMTFFGSYRGTDRADGLRWANPFYAKRKLSVRARNFNSEKLKVNDLRGNPIEIAAAILWRIEDTARASFDVEDFEAYVLTQAEAAVRHLASRYAYDNI